MIDLNNIDPNEYPGKVGSLLATLLELQIMNMATLQVILKNQASAAVDLNPLVDEDEYLKQSSEEVSHYYNLLKAEIYSKST